MSSNKIHAAAISVAIAVLATLFVSALPIKSARAAGAVFPIGSRVGLVPPPGMAASQSFAGFADPHEDAAILITTLPVAAYAQIEKSLNRATLDKRGLIVEKREPITLAMGKGFLIVGRQTSDKKRYRKWLLVVAARDLTALVSVQVPEHDAAYSDGALRAALSTLAVREKVPQAEELKLLPFTIGNLAGFKVAAVLPGRAVIIGDLADEPAKTTAAEHPKEGAAAPAPAGEASKSAKEAGQHAADKAPATHMMIAAIPGGPSEFDDRGNFARLNFNEIGGITGIHDTISEPMRVNGQLGYQTEAQAKDEHSGVAVTVVQWLRFGNSGFLQMTAVAPAANWTATLERLRTVRDSIGVK